jgi:hypothetical protein
MGANMEATPGSRFGIQVEVTWTNESTPKSLRSMLACLIDNGGWRAAIKEAEAYCQGKMQTPIVRKWKFKFSRGSEKSATSVDDTEEPGGK